MNGEPIPMPANQSTPEATRADVTRELSGESVCGFRVAAYRETHPEHGAKFGHHYSEHWSTPNSRDPRVTVERLFTEDQLRQALSATPARGGDELREASFAGYRLQGPDGEDYFNDSTTPLSDNDRRNGWVETPLYALASTDMAGAVEVERSAIKEYLIACADAADAQKLRCGSDTAMRANLTAEAKAYRNAARMIFEQDHASYRTAAPPVEGLTSGEGYKDVDLLRIDLLRGALVSQRDWHVEQAKSLSKQPQSPAIEWRRNEHHEQVDNIYTVLNKIRRLAASPKATATASVRELLPEYGTWLPNVWDAYLRELVGWQAADNWARLPATFRWSDFYDRIVASLTDSGTAATIGGERA